MNQSSRFNFCQIGQLSFGLICLSTVLGSGSAIAQIVPDATLPINSRVDPGCTICTINGGTPQGRILFHSFDRFSIPLNGEARFNNDPAIRSIMTRVTGGQVSEINGLIRANGSVNLFLINPNGITFGANAQLRLGGSFVASTANSFLFPGGGQFSATNPATLPVLDIQVEAPIGLQFEGQPKPIEVRNASLRVGAARTLALVGGDVKLDNAQLTSELGGRIELGGLAKSGSISLVDAPLRLAFPNNTTLGNISIENSSHIHLLIRLDQNGVIEPDQYDGNNRTGNIALNASNITILNNSQLIADGAFFAAPVNVLPAQINLYAKDSITIEHSSIINQSGGDIRLGTTSFKMRDNSQILSEIDGATPRYVFKENAQVRIGNISILVSDKAESSNSIIALTLKTNPVNTKTDDYYYGEVVPSSEDNTAIKTLPFAVLPPYSAPPIFDLPLPNLVGDPYISDSPIIRYIPCCSAGSTTVINGDGTIPNQAQTGSINLLARSISIGDGARIIINSSTRLNEEATVGNINIGAGQAIKITGNGSGIFSSVGSSKKVQVGNININAASLTLANQASLATSITGTVDSPKIGNIIISTNDFVFLSNSKLTTTSSSPNNAGNIGIRTNRFELNNNSTVAANSQRSGTAGDIQAVANFLSLDNQSRISAKTNSTNGGNIGLSIRNLLLMRHGSEISTDAGTGQAGGNGGNIRVEASNGFVVAPPSENSDITANAYLGKGGTVDVNALKIFGITARSRSDLEILDPGKLDPTEVPTSDISAISRQNPNLNGQLNLNQLNVDPSQGLNQVPQEPRTTEVVDSCQITTDGREVVRFYDIERGGLPIRPDDPLSIDLLEWSQLGSKPTNSGAVRSAITTQQSSFMKDSQAGLRVSTSSVKLRPPCQF